MYITPTELTAYQKVATTPGECTASVANALDATIVGDRFYSR